MPWASHIKEMLFTLGFGYVWLAQDLGNSTLLLSLFSQRLKDCYFQDWLAKINESPKAEHYKNFKSLLDVEKYLFLDLSFEYRNALAKLIWSSHSLMVEKGRHMHLDRPIAIVRYVFNGMHMYLNTNITF